MFNKLILESLINAPLKNRVKVIIQWIIISAIVKETVKFEYMYLYLKVKLEREFMFSFFVSLPFSWHSFVKLKCVYFYDEVISNSGHKITGGGERKKTVHCSCSFHCLVRLPILANSLHKTPTTWSWSFSCFSKFLK